METACPDILSPSMVALKSSFKGPMGVLGVAVHETSLPLTVPPVNVVTPIGLSEVPLKELPSVLSVILIFWSPIGV